MSEASVLRDVHAHSSQFLDHFLFVVTTLGNVEVLVPITLLVVLYLLRKNMMGGAKILFLGFFGAGFIDAILKPLIHRHRPGLWHSRITETSYSLPSGHATLTSALVLGLVLVAWQTRYKWWVTIPGVIFVLLVGYSRLYFGVHYPTDILAGWCLGIASVSAAAFVVRRMS